MKEMRGIHKFTWRMPSVPRLAALTVGILATTGVWATDYITTYSQNFDSPTYLTSADYTGNWHNSRPIVTKEGITTTGGGYNSVSVVAGPANEDESASNCLQFNSTSRGLKGAYFAFPTAKFSGLTDYIFEFDVFLGSGGFSNADTSGDGDFSFVTLTGVNDDDLISIHVPKVSYDSYGSLFLKKDWSESATFWNSCTPSIAANSSGGLTIRNRGNAPTSENKNCWHRIKLVANTDDGIHVTVTRLSDSKVLLNNQYAGSFNTLSQLTIVSKHGHVNEYFAVDNFKLQTPKPEGAPDAPAFSSSGSPRNKITVTLATPTENATIYYWIGEGNEADKVAYSAPFELDDSSTIYAYSEKDGISSETTSQYYDSNLSAYTLNAPVITRLGFGNVKITASQNSVYNNPVPTINYQGGSMEGPVSVADTYSTVVAIPNLDANAVSVTASASHQYYTTSATTTYTTLTLPTESYGVWKELDYAAKFLNQSGSTSWNSDRYTSSVTGSEVEYWGMDFGGDSLNEWVWYEFSDNNGTPRWVMSGEGLEQNNNGTPAIVLRGLPAGSYVYINSTSKPSSVNNLTDKTSTFVSGQNQEYVYQTTEGGDCAIKYDRYAILYAVRVYSPAVASVDGIGVATLDELATKVVAGSVVKPQNSTPVASIENYLASGLYLADNNDDTYTATAFNAPTAEVTAVSGINQTVTITADNGLSIYTSTDGETYTLLEGTTLTLSSVANPLYVKTAITSAGGTLVYSAAVTLVVNAGTAVKCATPTSVTARGLSALYVNDSQSSVTPVKPSSYRTMYKIGDGETKETTNHYIDFEEENGTVITVWCEADGYANSDTVSFTVSHPSADYYAVRDEADLAAWTRKNKGATTHLYSGDDVEKFTTSGDFEFMPISFDSADKLCSGVVWGTAKDNNNKSRWYTVDSKGVYTYSITQLIAIKDCKAGDLIYFNSVAAKLPPATSKYYCDASEVKSNLAVADGISGGNYENWYTVQKDGNAYIMVEQGSGNPVFAIRVYSPAAAKVNGVGYVTVDAAIAAAAESGGSMEVVDGSTLSGQNITLKPGVAITGLGETSVGNISITTTVGSETVDITSYYTAESLAVVNGKIEPQLAASVQVGFADGESTEAAEISVEEGSVKSTFTLPGTNVKKGLYYSVGTVTNPAATDSTEIGFTVLAEKQATADNQAISLDAGTLDFGTGNVLYYKWSVSDTPQKTAAE